MLLGRPVTLQMFPWPLLKWRTRCQIRCQGTPFKWLLPALRFLHLPLMLRTLDVILPLKGWAQCFLVELGMVLCLLVSLLSLVRKMGTIFSMIRMGIPPTPSRCHVLRLRQCQFHRLAVQRQWSLQRRQEHHHHQVEMVSAHQPLRFLLGTSHMMVRLMPADRTQVCSGLARPLSTSGWTECSSLVKNQGTTKSPKRSCLCFAPRMGNWSFNKSSNPVDTIRTLGS